MTEEIIRQVGQLQRTYGRGIYPRDVQAHLGIAACEMTYRRYMVAAWQAGRLVRIGGDGARRGYRLSDWEWLWLREAIR